MSALRLCLLAVLLIAGTQMAAGQGLVQTCPSTPKNVYGYTNISAQANCTTALCTCTGGTVPASGSGCTWKTWPNCSLLTSCTQTFITCSNAVPANTDLYMSIVGVNAGALYNTSLAYTACQAYTCGVWNYSNTNASCAIPYSTVCVSPAISVFVLTIGGNFTGILSNATATALLWVALATDLTNVLGFPATIISTVAGSLIVTFSVPVSANNPALQAGLATAKAGAGWLTSTQAAYTALGGVGTLTVIGIAQSNTPAPVGTPTPATVNTPSPNSTTPTSSAALSTIAQLLVAALALLLLA